MTQVNQELAEIMDNSKLGLFQIRVIAICFFIAMLDGFDTQSIAFVAPSLRVDWNLPLDGFGVIFSSSLFGTMLGAVTLGPLADLIGRKSSVIISVLTFGIMSLLCSVATTVDELLIYRFITGLGLGGAIPNIIALTSEYAPVKVRTTAITIMFIGFPLGAILGGMGSAQLIEIYGWTAVFMAGGILPLLLIPFILFGLPESVRYLTIKKKNTDKVRAIIQKFDTTIDTSRVNIETSEMKPSKKISVKGLFSEGRSVWTMLLWCAMAMSLLLTYFLVNWIPSILADLGLTRKEAVMGIIIMNIGGIFGSLIIARLSDRYGPFYPLIVGYSIGAVAVATLGFNAEQVNSAMTVSFIIGFFVIGAQLTLTALSARYYPVAIRSTGVGWSMGIGRTGSVIGPMIGGALIAYGLSWENLFIVAAIPALIVAISIYFMKSNVPQVVEKEPGNH